MSKRKIATTKSVEKVTETIVTRDNDLKSKEKRKVIASKPSKAVLIRRPWYRRWSALFKALLLVLVVPPFLNYAALQKEAVGLKPTVGELYDVGWGQKMFLACHGKGAPTVILDAPTGVTSDVWTFVIPYLSIVTKVCVYDRAGLGFSDRPYINTTEPDGNEAKSNNRNKWTPFTVERMAEDLHHLITVSSTPEKPFILVGSEIGAIIAQFYAQMYESDVTALLLINPLSEDIFEQDNGVWTQFWFGHLIPSFQALQLGASLGVTRIALLLGLLEQPLQRKTMPDDVIKRQKYLMCHPRHLSSVVDEHHFINATFSQIALARKLKSLPSNMSITMVTGNYYDEQLPSHLNKAWAKSEQNLLSRLPARTQHIVVNGADHHMLYTKPLAIAEPISRFIKQYLGRKGANYKFT